MGARLPAAIYRFNPAQGEHQSLAKPEESVALEAKTWEAKLQKETLRRVLSALGFQQQGFLGKELL